jgi:putative restriction endonuclease
MDRQVWEEFEADPESVAFEAEQALAAMSKRDLAMSDSVEWEDVRGLDRERLVKVRVNQCFFRTMILSGYRSVCAVCQIPLPALLVASHIVPWSIDPSNRMNPRNGICLCVLHDKAFDRGLLGFNEDLTIEVYPEVLAASESEAIKGVFLTYVGRRLSLPDRWHPDPLLIRRHNELNSITG